MVKSCGLFRALMLLPVSLVSAQELHSINYSYYYDQSCPFTFEARITTASHHPVVVYHFAADSASNRVFDLNWEARPDFGADQGTVLTDQSVTFQTVADVTGEFPLPAENTPPILVARIIDRAEKRAWLYPLKPASEMQDTGLLYGTGNMPVIDKYVHAGASFEVSGLGTKVWVSYYDHSFPPASPPFATAQSAVSPHLERDMLFFIDPPVHFTPEKTGLYLLQADTSDAAGLALRAVDDYPRYMFLENIISPLVYVTTRQEFQRLEQSYDDKRLFDRIILNITEDKERAHQFMRSYFRRVELANRYFTSYKEGWKSDRGMMFVVFGPPDEVYFSGDREIWKYTSLHQFQCSFVPSPTVFDTQNLVLVRDEDLQKEWFETIDLWRKARF